ncbi:MAG TPA: hypothetical protein VF121_13890 [Thermoanaerobaculia bacterium]|nr:hypothetical protein [Thermoanaerobaculia bacterium]
MDTVFCERSWTALVERHGPALRRRVRRTLALAGARAHAEQVDDMVQEVYCRLLAAGGRRLQACRDAANERTVAAYLGRTAERVVLDQLRLAAAVKRGGGRLVELAPEEVAERAADPQGTPEDHLLAAERRRELAARCRAATRPGARGRRDARILELALLDGWTCREIARATRGRLALGSVASLLHRLRRRLEAQAAGASAAERLAAGG